MSLKTLSKKIAFHGAVIHLALKFMFISILMFLFTRPEAKAYPEFIGYGYGACITCHYNGNGNGALNNYGKALWATEISDRKFLKKKSLEEISDSSGFPMANRLPGWLTPGIKSRGLALTTNPGGDSNTRYIVMQADANLAVHFDQEQKYVLVGSYGYAPIPHRRRTQPDAGDIEEWTSREHYFRMQASESLFLYAGMMDKVYGLRIANHTAFSRAQTGLAQNDQSHGVVAQYYGEGWEFSANGFFGNQFQDKDLRHVGGSFMGELELNKDFRVGVSGLRSKNDFVKNQRFGIHSRSALDFGSSILAEAGLINDTPKVGENQNGYYVFTQLMHRFAKGYHIFASGQLYKPDMNSSQPDRLRNSFGLLTFPTQRMEFRIEIENGHQMTSQAEVGAQTWNLLTQVHVSL